MNPKAKRGRIIRHAWHSLTWKERQTIPMERLGDLYRPSDMGVRKAAKALVRAVLNEAQDPDSEYYRRA